jgi:hypothetical protein
MKSKRNRQPLSRCAYIVTRIVVLIGIAAFLASAVVAWFYWHRLQWPYKLVLELIGIFFFWTAKDVRGLFMSYNRYRREWERRRNQETPTRQ